MQRRKLETAAANYSYLRGWFYLPGGALAILAALGNWQVGPLREDWAFLVAAALIGALFLPIARWYNEHYGRISISTRQQVRALVALVAGVGVVVGGSLLLRSRAGWSLDLPVNATAVTLALIMLLTYAIGVGLRAHHVAIWGALLVAGALPVWTGADPSNIGLVMAGVAFMVCGVFDHRLLVRTLGPPTSMQLQDRDAGA